LEGLNLDLREGETVLLMGPSGCGKSTLALLLAGLYPEYGGHSVGSVRCREGELKDLSPERRAREVSIVFQNPDDQFVMDTVAGEILFALENVAYRGDYRARLGELLETVGLPGFGGRKVLYLSGGEKQKLSLATALATEPRLLILDEPLANLDRESGQDIARALEALARGKMGLLVIDHRTEPWLGWLDRIILLDGDGREIAPNLTPGMARENPGIFERLRIFGPGEPQRHGSRARPLDPGGGEAPAVLAEDLTLRRGKELIWERVSLSARRGTITAIMGPSGIGKSSLLLALSGFLRVKGRLEVHGRVGLVFQNPGFQFLTQKVISEIALSLAPGGKKAAGGEGGMDPGIFERARGLALEFGLGDSLDRSPWQLSQGQQRRLAVLTMLAAKADILFLDEPTYAQDLRSTDHIMALLEAEVEKGLTAVMATHDLGLAKFYADRIYAFGGKSLSLMKD
jgi:energy-coupling factor transport system ATP-binding protein